MRHVRMALVLGLGLFWARAAGAASHRAPLGSDVPASSVFDGHLDGWDAPPPTPLPAPPGPRPEGEEYARRSWEAFPLVGRGTPFCQGNSFGVGRCAEAG